MKHLLHLSLWAFLLAQSCAGTAGKDVELQSEADLPGHTVATIAGTYYDIALSSRSDIRLLKYKNVADCIEVLTRGMADVYVTDEIFITEQTCRRHGIRRAFTGEESFPVAFAVRKGDSLAASFNSFLNDFRVSGGLDTMLTFWIGKGDVPTEDLPVYSDGGTGEPIRVGTGNAIAPISYVVDEKWTGLEVELIRRFAAALGRPVEILELDFPSLIMALQTHTVDMAIGSIFVTEERKGQVDFTDSFVTLHPAYFVVDRNAVQEASFWQRIKDSFHQNLIVEGRWKYILKGLWMTLRITLLSILLGSLLGALLCAMTLSRRKWMQRTASAYKFLMNGIPMLVLLLIMFYVVLSGTGMSPAGIAIIAFALNFAAGASGVFATGIRSVPRGQTEAGLALGFTKAGTFNQIVLPQAIRKALPLYKGNCISLLKGTSIVGYISIHDLTRASDMIRNRTFDAFLPLIVVTVIYFLLAWAIGILLDLAFNRILNKS